MMRSRGVRASIINPLKPRDQPAQDGANVSRLERHDRASGVEMSYRAVVDEQGIGLRPIGPSQRVDLAAEAISHTRTGHHTAPRSISTILGHR
jgi:hypothetical protein